LKNGTPGAQTFIGVKNIPLARQGEGIGSSNIKVADRNDSQPKMREKSRAPLRKRHIWAEGKGAGALNFLLYEAARKACCPKMGDPVRKKKKGMSRKVH